MLAIPRQKKLRHRGKRLLRSRDQEKLQNKDERKLENWLLIAQQLRCTNIIPHECMHGST